MNNLINRSQRKVIALVVGMLMVLAMMPGMAFADTGSSVTITNPPTSVRTGVDTYMTSSYTTDYEGTVHIDWTVENKTGTATIGKHNGKLVGGAAGTVTVTATLRTGEAAGGTGTGTGGGNGNVACTGEALASSSVDVTVLAAQTYGYQGEGGNTLLMEQVNGTDLGDSDVEFWEITTAADGLNVYNNTIVPTVTATNNTISFGYTMSAGINNFQPSKFATYKNQINIYTYDSENETIGTELVAGIALNNFSSSTRIVTIDADVSNLTNGETYVLRFGPDVCGNNDAKKLGCYLDFQFELAK